MKGFTHAAIGIGVVGIIHSLPITTLTMHPVTSLPLFAGYFGALMPDIDTGFSTISNSLSPLKIKYWQKIVAIVYFALGFSAYLTLNNSKYRAFVLPIMIITAISLSRISNELFYKVKRAILVCSIIGVIGAGLAYGQLPIILSGIYILTLIISPHRGYSHSLIAVLGGYAVLKYICVSNSIPDMSIYFAVGMASHILADMFTDAGVKVFFPYPKRIRLPLRIVSGGWTEKCIAILAFLFFARSISL